MEPRDPFIAEPDPEEPLEADDYYDAMRMGWPSSDANEDVEEDADDDIS